MTPIDQRQKLEEKPFDYRILKDQGIQVYWEGRPIMLLLGGEAQRLIKRLEAAGEDEEQLILAKATGNFKRGNEKEAKLRGK